MAPPSAADGLDRAYRPAVVGYQGFDVEERLKLPQILCHFFPCRQKSADFDRRSQPTTGSPDCRVPLATTISFNLSIGEASYQSIPGHPRWGLAPIEMAWEGKTPGEICRQIKDPARNGGRDLALLHEHVARDNLVGWAWHPGAGRRPAPGSQQQFGTIIQAWIDTGAPLKFLMRFPASAPIAQWNTIATSTLYRSTQEKIHG